MIIRSYTYHLSANATRPMTTSKVTVVVATIITFLLLANWGSPAMKNTTVRTVELASRHCSICKKLVIALEHNLGIFECAFCLF